MSQKAMCIHFLLYVVAQAAYKSEILLSFIPRQCSAPASGSHNCFGGAAQYCSTASRHTGVRSAAASTAQNSLSYICILGL